MSGRFWTLVVVMTCALVACGGEGGDGATGGDAGGTDPGDSIIGGADTSSPSGDTSTPSDADEEGNVCGDYCAKFGECDPASDCLEFCEGDAGPNVFASVAGCPDILRTLVDCWVADATCETVGTPNACPTEFAALLDQCVGPYCSDNPDAKACLPTCDEVVCENDGVCVEGDNGATCECLLGYEGDHCETDIDDCAPEPCQNGGECYDKVGSFGCWCSDEFTGDACETACVDCLTEVKVGVCQQQWIDCENAVATGDEIEECFACVDAFDACRSPDEACPGFLDYCDSEIPLVQQQMQFCYLDNCPGCHF